jgi:hypothetical protein
VFPHTQHTNFFANQAQFCYNVINNLEPSKLMINHLSVEESGHCGLVSRLSHLFYERCLFRNKTNALVAKNFL